MVFFAEKSVGYVMEEVGMRAVFVVQFGERVFKGKLDGLDGFVCHVGRQRTDQAFEGGGEDVVLHTQNVVGFFQIFEALFDAAHDVFLGIC
ncbi:hypothetical protein NEISICOT_01544 [Neisseria sicca ATCC 29256]|uniref:Uncharacterized protein n=1 Tax=Neisseria sicca ATCC 29256 TaxID=547045 RepID=C6M4U5_NEISI|nr:hypothetical protein NEISICOT_01544 [Neisseria sicca ATCC 29256]